VSSSTGTAALFPNWYLIADLRDVFFNSDPFVAMASVRNTDNSTLFVGRDYKSWWENTWAKRSFRKCYGKRVYPTWRGNLFLNCGLWGGTSAAVTCILKCMAEQFHFQVRHNFCDMVVHNYCVYYGGCFPDDDTKGNANSDEHVNFEDHKVFNRRFGTGCEKRFPAIHNKCGPTLCLRESHSAAGLPIAAGNATDRTATKVSLTAERLINETLCVGTA
jgi:hypothetical protein